MAATREILMICHLWQNPERDSKGGFRIIAFSVALVRENGGQCMWGGLLVI
jgi:hypothetical protein